MNDIKIGVCAWSYPSNDTLNHLSKMKDLGITAISINMPLNYKEADVYTTEGCKNLLKIADENGIEVDCLAMNILCSCPPFKAENTEILDEAIIDAVKIAKNLNVNLLQVPAFGQALVNTEEEFLATAKYLKKLSAYAKKHDIIVGTENPFSIKENYRLIELVGEDNFKIYFDTQNPHAVNGYNCAEMVTAFGDLICQIHAKDGVGTMGNRKLAEGNSDFYDTCEAIKKLGYKGAIHLENKYLSISENDFDKAIEILKYDIDIMKKVFM